MTTLLAIPQPAGRGPRDIDGWGCKRWLRSWPWRACMVRRVLIKTAVR